ncbi:MAG TPA: chorismate lyase [Gammaproteobacteria bacterium]|nr:chorismate lyase [Gammaproteobacteria bacterium]
MQLSGILVLLMKNLMSKIRREPVWMPAGPAVRRRIPAVLRPWLLETSSLTERLQACCRKAFRVRLLQLGWQRPMYNERHLVGARDWEYALVRHVHLMCGSHPWVFARTVIPLQTMRGAQRQLAHLGERPLGALLFADHTVRRGAVEIARITPDHGLYHTALGGDRSGQDAIWGRRSLFYFGVRPLLVSEIFLPAHRRQACVEI